MIDSKQDFVAIGRLAHSLRVRVQDVEAVVQQLDIAPTLLLNSVPFFDARQVDEIREAMEQR